MLRKYIEGSCGSIESRSTTGSVKCGEVDSAEDNNKTCSQFTIVSHRAEMQLWADRIVGVYLWRDFPAAVSVKFNV